MKRVQANSSIKRIGISIESAFLPVSVFLLTVTFVFAIAGCGSSRKRVESSEQKKSALEQSLSQMSLKQLDEANLVMKVAFNKSLESWQGAADDIVAGCRISGKLAEAGLAAIVPRRDQEILIEAKRLQAAPKSYQLPVNVDNCESNCSCGLGLNILEKAALDEQPHSKLKEFKRVRSGLEAKAELITSERIEICAESATWICTSDFLKALKP